MPLGDLGAKYEQFGWHVQEIDGHNFHDINGAIFKAKAVYDKPSVIIARTIPGKGVKEFERDYRWHGNPPGLGPTDKIPKDKQGEVALAELRTLGGKIQSEHQ
jgi:transketolase